tara:strand:+ start:1020 stop:1313 length:294 start_codon:yes stop_codon:yes gene_type:complete
LFFGLNTYIIEFFALGRGCGISMALMLGGMFYLFEYLKNFRKHELIKFCLFFTFATSANLMMVLPFTTISFYLVLQSLSIEAADIRWSQNKNMGSHC